MVQYISVAPKPLQAAVAQSVERRIGSAEVTGPIPVSSLKIPDDYQGFFVTISWLAKCGSVCSCGCSCMSLRWE